MHSQKHSCCFSLLLQVFELFYYDLRFTELTDWAILSYISTLDSCNAVPGDLPSKFTMSEKHTYGAGYVMQMSKCMIYG